MLTSVFAQCILFLTVRIFSEGLQTRNAETPGRIASIIHSIGTSYFILCGENAASIKTTLFAFVADFILNLVYNKSIRFSSILHHVAGATLCAFSLYNKTYKDHIWAPITMSLVSMEMTNPIVHFSILCHDEFPHLFTMLKIPLSMLVLTAWFYIRIWNLGKNTIMTMNLMPVAYFGHWYVHCVLVLCGMQIYWLWKLFKAAMK